MRTWRAHTNLRSIDLSAQDHSKITVAHRNPARNARWARPQILCSSESSGGSDTTRLPINKPSLQQQEHNKVVLRTRDEDTGAQTATLIERLSRSEAASAQLAKQLAELEQYVSKVEQERDENKTQLRGLQDLTAATLKAPTSYNAMIQEVIAARAYYVGLETGSEDRIHNWYQAILDFSSGRVPFPKELLPDLSVPVGDDVAPPLRPASTNKESDSVLGIILGGGVGSRLMPLTQRRAKPAVPIGGAYRLIDVPMSNCINSDIHKIYVLTQFNSRKLNKHLRTTFDFSRAPGSTGFVEVLSAYQEPESAGEKGQGWFQGTADAVRKFSWMLTDQRTSMIDDVLILAGDHLYRMDYMEFVGEHRNTGADITVACKPMHEEKASEFGVMRVDRAGRITAFAEKPKGEKLRAFKVDLAEMAVSKSAKPKQTKKEVSDGSTTIAEEKNEYLVSMGIYVFKKDVLVKLLKKEMPKALDFGSEILPDAVSSYMINAYRFDDYWEDIGTIKSFYKANLALAQKNPAFDFYGLRQPGRPRPIYTSSRTLAPAKILGGKFSSSIVAKGCFIEKDCVVTNSIVGIRMHLEEGVELEDVLILGSDHYEDRDMRIEVRAENKIPIGIGAGTIIKNAIVDKNVRIGRNCRITNPHNVQKMKNPMVGYYVDEGITVIMAGAVIPDGTTI